MFPGDVRLRLRGEKKSSTKDYLETTLDWRERKERRKRKAMAEIEKGEKTHDVFS